MAGHPEIGADKVDLKGPLLQHLPTLAEVAGAAVFLASTDAGAMTGTTLNLSAGSLPD
jgi:3-oxoacyl-[acyl-carrier protein] reductase